MTTHRNFSRRTFLKSTVAAGTVAPFILPSHIWAAETKPNDRLTLGFIGTGTQGRGLMSGFQDRKETRVLAVRSEEHTSELQSLAYLVCRLLLEKKKILRERIHV